MDIAVIQHIGVQQYRAIRCDFRTVIADLSCGLCGSGIFADNQIPSAVDQRMIAVHQGLNAETDVLPSGNDRRAIAVFVIAQVCCGKGDGITIETTGAQIVDMLGIKTGHCPINQTVVGQGVRGGELCAVRIKFTGLRVVDVGCIHIKRVTRLDGSLVTQRLQQGERQVVARLEVTAVGVVVIQGEGEIALCQDFALTTERGSA